MKRISKNQRPRTSLRTSTQMTRALLRKAIPLLALMTALQSPAEPVSPGTTELQTGWRLASSWNVVEEGRVISRSSYDASQWYPIAKMPATVLQILRRTVFIPISILERTLRKQSRATSPSGLVVPDDFSCWG